MLEFVLSIMILDNHDLYIYIGQLKFIILLIIFYFYFNWLAVCIYYDYVSFIMKSTFIILPFLKGEKSYFLILCLQRIANQ